jgi:hypothetical protein
MNAQMTGDIRDLTSNELESISGGEKVLDVTIFGVRIVLGSNENGTYGCVFSGGQGGCRMLD